MDLTVVRTDDPSGAVLARVGGDLDVTTEAAFTRRAQELGLEAAVRLVVDLTEVTFLDVAGRAALAQLAQHVTDGLGRLALVTLPRNRRLLHVTHLDQLITVFDTVEEGLTWINVDPSLRPRLLASSIGGYQQPLLTPSPRESLGMGFPRHVGGRWSGTPRGPSPAGSAPALLRMTWTSRSRSRRFAQSLTLSHTDDALPLPRGPDSTVCRPSRRGRAPTLSNRATGGCSSPRPRWQRC